MSTALTTAPASDSAGVMGAIGGLPAKRVFILLAAVAVLVSIVAASFMWTKNADYRVLYANLSDRDGGAVIAALSQMNVPYKFAEAGGAILVPSDKVHDARLKLASQGLPKGSIVGFEILENPKFGMTQFQEKLSFQRGLEGELARSIQALAAVSTARVHLALPAQTGFFREQQKPSASVLLTLNGGRTLDRSQIAGIVHLVASSVPDLAPKSVSVIDQTGALLSGQGDNGPNSNGLDPSQLQYVRQIEQSTIKRITDILEPLVGAANVRAQVTAELDFSQTESTAELYKPNQAGEPAAVRSQQVSEAGGAGNGPQGVPGALTNQPPAPATAPVTGANPAPQAAGASAAAANAGRREAVTNYEVDKTVRVTRAAVGSIKRLTAAVVINHKKGPDRAGKPTYVALPAAQMEQINALVREAVGFSKERGDSINVVNAPFSIEETPKEVEVPIWKQPDMIALGKDIGMQALLVILGLIVIFGFIRPSMKAIASRPRQVVSAVIDDPQSLPMPTRQAPMTEEIRRMAKDNPATVANVVRSWVSQ